MGGAMSDRENSRFLWPLWPLWPFIAAVLPAAAWADQVAERELGNVTWIIDYNRQSLDAVVREGLWEKFESMFRNFGWDVVIVKYGTLMQAAFASLPIWQILYGILYAAVWIGIGYVISERAFYQFVVTKEGVRNK